MSQARTVALLRSIPKYFTGVHSHCFRLTSTEQPAQAECWPSTESNQVTSIGKPFTFQLAGACMCREQAGLTAPARSRGSRSTEEARKAAAREIRRRDMGVFAGMVDALEDAIDGLGHVGGGTSATGPSQVLNHYFCCHQDSKLPVFESKGSYHQLSWSCMGSFIPDRHVCELRLVLITQRCLCSLRCCRSGSEVLKTDLVMKARDPAKCLPARVPFDCRGSGVELCRCCLSPANGDSLSF